MPSHKRHPMRAFINWTVYRYTLSSASSWTNFHSLAALLSIQRRVRYAMRKQWFANCMVASTITLYINTTHNHVIDDDKRNDLCIYTCSVQCCWRLGFPKQPSHCYTSRPVVRSQSDARCARIIIASYQERERKKGRDERPRFIENYFLHLSRVCVNGFDGCVAVCTCDALHSVAWLNWISTWKRTKSNEKTVRNGINKCRKDLVAVRIIRCVQCQCV